MIYRSIKIGTGAIIILGGTARIYEMSTIRDLRHIQYAQVETELLRDPTISPQCKALYGLLITYGPERIFPGHQRLADCLGTSTKSIRRWLNQLRARGLIDWSRRGSTSNEYTILGYANLMLIGHQRPIRSDTGDRTDRTQVTDDLDPVNQIQIKESPSKTFPSDSNFTPRPEAPPQESILEKTDMLSMSAEIVERTGGKKSMTVPAAAGGADPYQDGPLTAACSLFRISPESLGDDETKMWARKLQHITEAVKDGTPKLFVEACRMWADHGPAWKGKDCAPYPGPFVTAFGDDIQTLMRQIVSGTITTRREGLVHND